jgi:hypothetical protein
LRKATCKTNIIDAKRNPCATSLPPPASTKSKHQPTKKTNRLGAFVRIYVMSVAQAIFVASGENRWPRIFVAVKAVQNFFDEVCRVQVGR